MLAGTQALKPAMLPVPAPGFDDPLAMLAACHERILRQCATLEKLAGHLRDQDLTPEARTAAAEVHRYFSTAGRHHHEDEEQDVFPLLRGDASLARLIDALTAEHRQMESIWLELEPLLAQPETIRDPDDFSRLVDRFNRLYAVHIERENQELLPRATELLPAGILAVIGARMAARRGVTV